MAKPAEIESTRVTPETVGLVKTDGYYIVTGFDKTIDLDTNKVYDLNGTIGAATDDWKIINGVMCRKFYHLKGAEKILEDENYTTFEFYLPDLSQPQDGVTMGFFAHVTDEEVFDEE